MSALVTAFLAAQAATEDDDDDPTTFTQTQLEAMTVAKITALAQELGYTISGANKAAKIASFLAAQQTAYEARFQLTEDESLVEGKTYYARTGEEGAYVFTAVEEPSADDIATYYEEVTED